MSSPLGSRRRTNRLRIFVAIAAVVSGLLVGLVVVMMVRDGGTGSSTSVPYQPFLAGRDDRIERRIADEGPIFYSDPRGGTKALYLDVDDGEIVALHVIPPGGSLDCPVEWDRDQARYETCRGDAIDPATLDRFLVTTRPSGDHEVVTVDVRTTHPGPG